VKFFGLFVGIDRYADPRVPWLSGAARDAAALHALFSDTFGVDATLLTDNEATTAAIGEALKNLAATTTSDDIVVVTFSGHGSEDHYLVSHDADVDRLGDTCLGLDELGTALTAIPGKTLLCVLDCCFSGGLGARVLSPDLRARAISRQGVGETLDRFIGHGRIVLTASAEDEEAHESARSGHGLLTNRLIEALQGAPEVIDNGQVSLYKLVEYVTRCVQADAAHMGRTQTPTLRGKLDGAPTWPVLVPGGRYGALFPDRVRQPAVSAVQSLAAFGFTQPIVDAWAAVVPQLNDLQLAAINEYGVLDGENLVVTAPTSSGKTMIGELAALHSALSRRRAVFLLPMRALVNDKFEHFSRVYGPTGLRTIRATGEHSDDVPAFLRGQFDIALLTYEKYSALALGNPHVLELAETVVIDEAQILADRTRGSNLEFVLTLLNRSRGRTGTPQIITLSAVVGNLNGLDRWLGGRNLNSTVRPVPLIEGVVGNDGSFRYLDLSGLEQVDRQFIQPLYEQGSRRLLIPLLQRLLSENKKVLVFRQSKGEAVACAVYLSRALGLPVASAAVDALPSGDASTSSGTLRMTLESGIAFHNSDLDRDERQVIEEQFRDPTSLVRVIVATPTLAMGVNTPASAVAIVGLTHPGPVPQPYTVAEYKNMVGRAGRLGFTEQGESYLIPTPPLDEMRAWSGYIEGQLEELNSQLLPSGDPRSLMLRVLAAYPPNATGVIAEQDVMDFLDSSFAAFQARQTPGQAQWDEASLRRGFEQLGAANLIEAHDDGYRLTDLGRFTGESGVHVDSILRLVHALRSAGGALNSVGLVAAAQLTNELDDVFMPANARARNTEVPRWPAVLGQQGVPGGLIRELQRTARDGAQAVARTKKAAAATYWIAGVPIETLELQLTQHMRQRGGVAGPVRSVADRTRDLLPAVAAVARELFSDQPIDELVARTMLRLELGVPAELVDLIVATRAELSRASWLALHTAGLTSVDSIKDADEADLARTLGSKIKAAQLRAAAVAASEFGNDVAPLVLAVPSE
jgi:ATP-dependent DNA helicase